MKRTQIYLTETEMKAVGSIARRLGKTQSEVIRTAVDRFVERETTRDRIDLLYSPKDSKQLPLRRQPFTYAVCARTEVAGAPPGTLVVTASYIFGD